MQSISKLVSYLIFFSVFVVGLFLFSPVASALTDCEISCSNIIEGFSYEYCCSDNSWCIVGDVYNIYNGVCTTEPIPSGACRNSYGASVICDNGATEYYPLHRIYWIGSGCPGSEICQCSKLESSWCPTSNLPDGSSCTAGTQCLGGYCCDGICQSTFCSGSCFPNGLSCEWNTDCCSGYCSESVPRSCMDPPPVPSCAIQNLSCPASCTIGEDIQVSYQYRNTNYTVKPYISQRLANASWTNLWCLADQAIYDNDWHNADRTVTCSDTVRVGAHSDASHWPGWCSVPWTDAQIGNGFGCSATCNITAQSIPAAIGYVKVKHPLGILSLRLIPPNLVSLLMGIIKVARFGGDNGAAADLVELSDPNASPVRVKTPYGIKAWRKQW